MNIIRMENFTRYVESSNFRFLEAMNDLVRIRDKNGEIVFENKAMRDVIASIFSAKCRKIKSSELFCNLYDDSSSEKASLECEITLNDRIYNVKASPLFNNGVLDGYIEVYRDITEEKRISNQLEKSKKKRDKDIMLAKNIQQSILPKKNIFNNISFQFAHIPSDNLSGDVFDVVEITKDKIGVYLADVVGHGISASMMTMFIRQSMRRILQENQDFGPEETILELKNMFSQLDLDINQYFSMIYFLIDTKENNIKYVNAGHNTYPILFNDSKIALLQNHGKLISNLFQNVRYKEKNLALNNGDKILLYTDGLTETKNKNGQYFNDRIFTKWIRNNRKEKCIVNKLIEDVSVFRYKEQADDIAVVFFEIGGKNEDRCKKSNRFGEN